MQWEVWSSISVNPEVDHSHSANLCVHSGSSENHSRSEEEGSKEQEEENEDKHELEASPWFLTHVNHAPTVTETFIKKEG